MDVGTKNLSAIIGPYVQSVLTATQKFGIPYFTTDDAPEEDFIPRNLLSVRPQPADLYRLTADVVRHYSWTSVAVLYDSPSGTLSINRQKNGNGNVKILLGWWTGLESGVHFPALVTFYSLIFCLFSCGKLKLIWLLVILLQFFLVMLYQRYRAVIILINVILIISFEMCCLR